MIPVFLKVQCPSNHQAINEKLVDNTKIMSDI
jgi:hypothetical protein